MIHLSIQEMRQSLEQSAKYFSEQLHDKVSAQECREGLNAMAKYRQSTEKQPEEKPKFEIPGECSSTKHATQAERSE